MPGTPVPKNSDWQTPAGKIAFHELTSALANVSYSVGYLDFSDASDTVEFLSARIDAIRDEILARNKSSQLINEQELKAGTFTGREFLVVQEQRTFTIVRTYLVHERLYQVAVQVPVSVAFTNGKATARRQDQTESFKSTAIRFFSSFDVPAIDETMDDFDRAAREIEKKNPGTLTVMCTPCGGDNPVQDSKTQVVVNGKAITLVTPAYPAIAHSAHASGQVRVQVLIDVEGNVAAARAVDGHPLLRAAAEKAARESKFAPTKVEGKLVNVNGIIIYNFMSQ